MRTWLMKSEPEEFSIDDLKKMVSAPWEGVRNYQARNFMLKDMEVGDLVLFYHSSVQPPGIAGLAKISKNAVPDPSSWDKKSPYYDPRSTPERPLWFMVEVSYVEKSPRFISLDQLRSNPKLSSLMVIRRGMRLSIQPVEKTHFIEVLQMGGFKTDPCL